MKSLFHAYSTKSYRPDIQGVRAVGALLIMVYHIWLNRISGGVDVFFVISGYFMTTVLLHQLATEGRIRPFAFWSRIITRIVPSAYTVLLATILLAYFFVPVTQWSRLMNEAVASAFHLENVHLMESSVDYLSRIEPPSAVQQFWALSIQMQFYLVLPFALMLATLAATFMRRLYPLVVLVCCGIAISFLYSLYSTAMSPSAAYFNPLARAWEFGAGILLGVLVPHVILPAIARQIMALCGLVALVLCGLIVPPTLHYPGYIALLPVMAAVFLILAGAGSQGSFVKNCLAHPFLTRLGDLSFCIYLWHWPLLVFYLQSSGRETATLPAGLIIIALALALAFATRALVEKPLLQRRKQQELRLLYASLILFFLPAATVASAIKFHFDTLVKDRYLTQALENRPLPMEAQLDASTVSYEEFIAAKAHRPLSYDDGCHQRTASPEVKVCAYGDRHSPVSVALVGGSHATQWLPALDRIGRQVGLKVLNITKSYCPLGALATSHASCVEWNKRVVAYLARAQPWLVITNATRAASGEAPEAVPMSYVEQWHKLAAYGIPVIGIRDNPQFEFDVAHCVARNLASPLACAKPRLAALSAKNPALEWQKVMPNLKLVDMTDMLCTRKLCTAVFANKLIYRDDEHLSVSYVDFLAPELHARLAKVAPEAFSPDRLRNGLIANAESHKPPG